MCGIAGCIHRGQGSGNIGHEMTAMLQSMKHRGPDSTGFALYGQPARADELRHALQGRRAGGPAEAASTSIEQIKRAPGRGRRPAPVAGRRDRRRATRRPSTPSATASATTATCGGFADYVEDVEGAEILSIGNALELIKDLGDAGHGLRPVPARRTSSARTPSATSAWRPSRTSTSARPTPSGPTRSSDVSVVHNGQLTNYWGKRRDLERQRPPLHVELRFRADRGLPRRPAGPAARRSRTPCGTRSRSSTACSPTGGDLGQPRHGQGRHGGQADGALRGRRLRRPRLRGGRDPQHLPPRDRHLRPLRRRGARMAELNRAAARPDRTLGLARPSSSPAAPSRSSSRRRRRRTSSIPDASAVDFNKRAEFDAGRAGHHGDQPEDPRADAARATAPSWSTTRGAKHSLGVGILNRLRLYLRGQPRLLRLRPDRRPERPHQGPGRLVLRREHAGRHGRDREERRLVLRRGPARRRPGLQGRRRRRAPAST